MNRVYSPAKDKWFQYENDVVAESVAGRVAKALACNMEKDDNGDWAPPAKSDTKNKKK